MDYRVFELPTANSDIREIESQWCAFNTALRNGEELDEVQINWMDTANTWLSTSKDKR